MYLLDTNTISDLIRHPDGIVRRRIAARGIKVVTSIVVVAEIRFGIAKRGSIRLAAQLAAVLPTLTVLPFDTPADHRYGQLRAGLERRGTPIGANDLFIAAHALALGATLVTDNVREFERVEGLAVENWLRD